MRLARQKRPDVDDAREREQPFRQIQPHHVRDVGVRVFAFTNGRERTPGQERRSAGSGLRFERDQRKDAVELN